MSDDIRKLADDATRDITRLALERVLATEHAPAPAGGELPERYAEILRDEIAKSLAATEARVRAEVWGKVRRKVNFYLPDNEAFLRIIEDEARADLTSLSKPE